MGGDNTDIKEHVLELLRNARAWKAFSSSLAGAISTAKTWGLNLDEDGAAKIIFVLSEYLDKIDTLHLTLINAVVPGNILLRASMPKEVPTSDPTRGYASTGKVGDGPIPHRYGHAAMPFSFGALSMPTYQIFGLGHAFGQEFD